jgi:FkbM family methyltransferase
MSMSGKSKGFVRTAFRKVGLRVMKVEKDPLFNLLGTRHLPIRSVIDVGANIGQFAKGIRPYFPDATIYCIEPQPEAFAALSTWAMTQLHVCPINLALGSEPGEFQFHQHLDHSPSSSLLPNTITCTNIYPVTLRQRLIKVQVETLDALVSRFDPPLADEILMKIDVQGYEDRVISGGVATLRRARVCIIEVNLDSLYQGQATFRELLNSVENLGLSYAGNLDQNLASDGRLIFFDAVFVRRNSERVNKT